MESKCFFEYNDAAVLFDAVYNAFQKKFEAWEILLGGSLSKAPQIISKEERIRSIVNTFRRIE